MDKKLTIKLDGEVIEEAKKYASKHNRSLSRVIESYLKSLVNREPKDTQEIQIAPFIKSISSGKSIPDDVDIKKEYYDAMISKHK